MSEFFTKIMTWVKANILLAVGILAVVVFVLFPKQIKKMFAPPRRRRRRNIRRSVTVTRRRTRSNRKPIPRSVGTSRRGYPAAAGGYIPFKYNKDGTVKKAWQVGGTVAAKNRMRGLRRKR